MKTFAVIDTQTNECVNAVLWNGVDLWSPPEGHYLIEITGLEVGPGFSYDPVSNKWTEPVIVVPVQEQSAVETLESVSSDPNSSPAVF